MQRWAGEERRCGVVQRGKGGTGTGGPTFTCGRQKSGGIP